MSVPLHDIVMPVFRTGLAAQRGFLVKGRAHAEAEGLDPQSLLEASLAPDMFNLIRQIQASSDTARRGAARMVGRELVSVADDEKTFDDLLGRIDTSLAELADIDAASFDGADDREVVLEVGQVLRFTGRTYALHWAVPNFLFHVTTSYNILRHKGVDLGKRDFLGPFVAASGAV